MREVTVGSIGLTVLIGGARSGKSDLAVKIGQRHERLTDDGVTFIATAQHVDDDMTARIVRHRDDRPAWCTIEEPLDLAAALVSAPESNLVIIDCLTLWVSNALFAEWPHDRVVDAAAQCVEQATQRNRPVVVVTNEVGLGIHPATELGRDYRDLLGRVNQRWVTAADRALLLIGGRAVRLLDPWDVLL